MYPIGEVFPAIEINHVACKAYNDRLQAEKKEPCTVCINACPFTRKPIYRDPITKEINLCRHCPPATAPCLGACRCGGLGRGALDIEGNVVIMRDSSLCATCAEKPCTVICPYGGIILLKDTEIPIKCDFCIAWQRKTKKWGAPPRCVEACPIKAIKYRTAAELLWLRLTGIEIIPDPPKDAALIEERLGGRVGIYYVKGESHPYYWYNLPRPGKIPSPIANKLVDERIASLIDYFCSNIGRIIDVKRIREARYITTEAYKKVEQEIVRGVIKELPKEMATHLRESGIINMRMFRRKEDGKLYLEVVEEGKTTTIHLPTRMLEDIADVIESLTHGPNVIKRLLQDKKLEEIEINGVTPEGTPIYVFDAERGHYKTNLIPRSSQLLKDLADKLASYSKEGLRLTPECQRIEETLPDGSRLTVVGPDLSKYGTNITIRKYVVKDVSPIWFCKEKEGVPGATSIEGMAMLWHLIEAGLHYLCCGPTASAKTTTLGVTTQFIPPSDRIICIEDVPEINIWQPNKVYLLMEKLRLGETRDEAMDKHIMSSLRMRPSRIIFGECRGSESRSYFGAALFGGGAPRGTATTIHVDLVEDLVERVRFKPMEIPPLHLLKLDLVIECARIEDPYTRKTFRCIKRFSEIERTLTKEGKIKARDLWRYDVNKKDFLPILGVKSELYKNTLEKLHISKEEFLELFKEKCYILHYLAQNNVDTGSEFVKYMSKYYAPTKPEEKISHERAELLAEAKRALPAEVKSRIDRIVITVSSQMP